MIEEGERVLLVSSEREYYVRAGNGNLSTDRGVLNLDTLIGASPGDQALTHLGYEFTILLPRLTDFFVHASRSGAPMLPKDIGLVIGLTGLNRTDDILDAGTGSGITATYFGGIARRVATYEKKPEFASLARNNIRAAKLENVEVIDGDVLEATGSYNVVHYDMMVEPVHIEHAFNLLSPGGYLACYTPFLEQTFTAIDAAKGLFREVHTHECMERELTRTSRGTRPSTRVCHSGYITIARK